jgi:hypothetical protein
MLHTRRDPQRMLLLRSPLHARPHRTAVHACIAGAWLGLAASVGACGPNAESAECNEDKPCGRGEVCDLEVDECVPAEVDITSTETPAPADFTAKPVPFFRGKVCTVHDVKSGAAIPVRLDPCFHPCITSNTFHHKHYYSCVGTHCEAWAMMYVEANGTACPADAFGAFDKALCVYDKPVDLTIAVTVDDEPVQGSLYLEVPFLNNADTAAIAADFENTDLINAKINQYPQDEGRRVGPMEINLSAASPAPPAKCEGDACPCYEVGF